MMFEPTATGYRATDEAVAFWRSRDTCPACGTPVEPTEKGRTFNLYEHDCGGSDDIVRWTRKA